MKATSSPDPSQTAVCIGGSDFLQRKEELELALSLFTKDLDKDIAKAEALRERIRIYEAALPFFG